jgi:general secretion pathway protein A
MYNQFFNLKQAPFSIAPDPRYLLMTESHREALAHLMYGVTSGGGLVLLTGEVGAGKTTICRCFLEQVPSNCNVAYIFNPKLTVNELLQAICDEFRIELKRDDAGQATVKNYVDALTEHLLTTHADGQNNVLIIDEAQNLSADVLEQLRLLTNLETNEHKLLQIILIGQPELRAMLDRPDMNQLAQRVIARYHLKALSEQETAGYIQHRLSVAGLTTAPPIQQDLVRQIHRLTKGVPRRINLLCNRALLGAYAEGRREVDRDIIRKAAKEVFGEQNLPRPIRAEPWRYVAGATIVSVALVGAMTWTMNNSLAMKTRSLAQSGAVDASDSGAPALPTASAGENDHAARSAPPAPSASNAQIVSDADGTSTLGLRNEDDAFRQLAELWGVQLHDDPCGEARNKNLHCYMSRNGLSELRLLDRPALLALRGRDDKKYYVLLQGLTNNSATISVGDATQTLSLLVLTRYFRGEFATFWRAPRLHRGNSAFGDQGPEVDWIAAQLAKLNGEITQVKNAQFDDRMVKQVRKFQSALGLKADGVVGPITFMHLNRAAGIDEPDLRNPVAAVRARTTE